MSNKRTLEDDLNDRENGGYSGDVSSFEEALRDMDFEELDSGNRKMPNPEKEIGNVSTADDEPYFDEEELEEEEDFEINLDPDILPDFPDKNSNGFINKRSIKNVILGFRMLGFYSMKDVSNGRILAFRKGNKFKLRYWIVSEDADYFIKCFSEYFWTISREMAQNAIKAI